MNKYYKGAVSLFIVVFFSLLVTVILVSFVRVTIKGLAQSTTNDLSQNAYDSAQAGVEDAKRALAVCLNNPAATGCDTLNSTTCNEALTKTNVASIATGESEVKIQQKQTGDNATALNQAYTCVTINQFTPDYLGSISGDASKTIPLKGVSSFQYVKLEWFKAEDAGSSSVSLIAPSAPIPLFTNTNYPTNRPSVMKTHFIKIANAFTFSSNIDATAQVATQFLYPSTISTSSVPAQSYLNPFAFNYGARNMTSQPLPIKCQANFNSSTYACTATIDLGASVTTNDTALLQLTSLYNPSNFKITLCSDSSCSGIVNFNGVQPKIDSTGRANDMFRRVEVRLEPNDTSVIPDAAVSTSGNFCKDFLITNTASDYTGNSC